MSRLYLGTHDFTNATTVGISGGFADWKTIGSGGDYADIQAMLDASEYRGVLIGSITEDSDVTPDANGLFLHLNGYTVTWGTNQIVPSTDCPITIMGWNQDIDELDYTATVSSEELIDTGANTGCVVTLSNLKIDNNSTQSGCRPVVDTCVTHYNNIVYEPPNVATNGIYINNDQSTINGLTVVSPGTTLTFGIFLQAGHAENVTMSGNFTTNNSAFAITSASANNITFTGSGEIDLRGDANVSNVNYTSGTLNVQCTTGNNRLSNFYSGSGAINLGSTNNNEFTNVTSDVTWGSSTDNRWTSCRFPSAESDAMDQQQFVGCLFGGNWTMSTGSDSNSFSACTFAGTLSCTGDQNIFSGNTYEGNVTLTGDRNRFSGVLNTSITLTLASGSEYNNVDVNIDQAVTDSSGNATNSISEIIY